MKGIRILVIVAMTALAIISIFAHKNRQEEIYYEMPVRQSDGAEIEAEAEVCTLTQDDEEEIALLMKCVQAEAGNQGFRGKRLVAAVVLNRVASEKFPNTINEVVYQKGQFAVAWNGALNKAEVDEETMLACRIELAHRSNEEILYFNNSPQVSGKFAFKYGGHWFGK